MKHALAEMLHAAMTAGDIQEGYLPMVGAIDHLLRACEASGDFQPRADAEDVLLVLGFLWRVPAGPTGEARANRLIELIMRGLGQ
jgi:hypothetical protein